MYTRTVHTALHVAYMTHPTVQVQVADHEVGCCLLLVLLHPARSGHHHHPGDSPAPLFQSPALHGQDGRGDSRGQVAVGDGQDEHEDTEGDVRGDED